MLTTDIITILGFALTYGIALVVAWININVKIKELEINYMNLKEQHNSDITELKKIIEKFMDNIQRVNDENITAHGKLIEKIDNIKDLINDIKLAAAQQQNK